MPLPTARTLGAFSGAGNGLPWQLSSESGQSPAPVNGKSWGFVARDGQRLSDLVNLADYVPWIGLFCGRSPTVAIVTASSLHPDRLLPWCSPRVTTSSLAGRTRHGFQTSEEGQKASPAGSAPPDAASHRGHRGLQHARCTFDSGTFDSGAHHRIDATDSDNGLSTECNDDRSRLRPADVGRLLELSTWRRQIFALAAEGIESKFPSPANSIVSCS